METEIQENNIITNEHNAVDVGAELKKKRVELGLSEREVATELKLPIEQVRALEANEFDHFRSKTFARGFLKNYIRLLKLDETTLIAVLDESEKTEETVIEPINKSTKQAQMADPLVILVSIVIGIALIFLAFWWPSMMQYNNSELLDGVETSEIGGVVETQDLTQIAENDLQSEILEAESDAPLETSSKNSDASGVVTGLSAETIALLKDAGVDANAIKVPENKNVPVSERDLIAETAAEIEIEEDIPFYAHDLVIEYIIDCWTEVRDSQGDILFSGVKKAGSTLTLTVDGTYKVILGYAPGVKSLVFKGAPIDLAPHTRQDLTRLELK